MQTLENHGVKPSKINRDNIIRHLIEYELRMVGKTMVDTISDDKWYFNWTLTPDQEKEFRGYAILLFKKIFKCNKANAEKRYQWFDLGFGLRVKS